MGMVIDNNTNYPLLNDCSLMCDYGFEVIWNASSGAKELKHIEYVINSGGTDLDKCRSRRRIDIRKYHWNYRPFLDTKFVVSWTFRGEFVNLFHDNGLIVIRNAYLDEFL
jgi:hypothetical protein